MKKVVLILLFLFPAILFAQSGTNVNPDSRALQSMVGSYGSTAVKDTVAHKGVWFAIQFLRDCYVDTIINHGVIQHRLDTIPAGTILFGDFTKFKARKYAGKYPPMVDLQKKQ